MGLHIISQLDLSHGLLGLSLGWVTSLPFWTNAGMVALGLGLVIFVHELGHFLVAKACGVKCEKFYLGFDVFGLKLFKFRYGETEYGIGLLPLGGYVKMLGQEDNPTKAAAEIERAKLAQTSPESLTPEEAAQYDPRSFLAQSVPERMAIISAGVIMNIIFAFALATTAYLYGVKEAPCVVGGLIPDYPAWAAGLRPGDKILEINNTKTPRFRDLQTTVILGTHSADGVPFLVERPGEKELLNLNLQPDRTGLAPRVGIASASSLKLGAPALLPIGVMETVAGEFQEGDVVVAIDGKPVESSTEAKQLLAAQSGPITVTVDRTGKNGETSTKEINIPARPMMGLGLVMEIGPVVAVQADSPAATAGIEPGDVLTKIDGQPIGDPMTLGERLIPRAGETIHLTVERGGKPIEMDLVVRKPVDTDEAMVEVMPADVIGVTYKVTNKVAAVEADSPAAAAGIKPGAVIESAEFIPPENATIKFNDKDIPVQFPKKPFEFQKEALWPAVVNWLQNSLPGTKVELRLADKQVVTLEPAVEPGQFNADRGFQFLPMSYTFQADSLGMAMKYGANETVGALTQVYRFLKALGTGQVSAKGMAGPLGILGMGYKSASEGLPTLMMFLVMLSANLAVLNFLPIPLLDGGHMVLLIYEGLRGKPASERIVAGVSYAGLIFILSLMAFLLLLDTGLISRI